MLVDDLGVRWKKEVDPDMTKAGILDCTTWVPETPFWHGEIVEDVNTGIRYKLKFEVPEGETPRMGGNYMKKIPLGLSDVLTEEYLFYHEKISKNLQKLKDYWLPRIRKFHYNLFEKPYLKIIITK